MDSDQLGYASTGWFHHVSTCCRGISSLARSRIPTSQTVDNQDQGHPTESNQHKEFMSQTPQQRLTYPTNAYTHMQVCRQFIKPRRILFQKRQVHGTGKAVLIFLMPRKGCQPTLTPQNHFVAASATKLRYFNFENWHTFWAPYTLDVAHKENRVCFGPIVQRHWKQDNAGCPHSDCLTQSNDKRLE